MSGVSASRNRVAWASRLRRLLTVVTVATFLVAPLVIAIPTPPAQAAISNRCDGSAANDQNALRVSPSHGSVFYIDSGQNIDAAYAAYRVENLSSTQARSDLWITIDSFSGGVVRLANPGDSIQPLGTIGASSVKTGFFLIKASSSSTTAQSHVIHVYSGKPGTAAAQELYSCSYSFAKVAETIKAAANKVQSITSSAVSTVGATMTIVVQGATGTVGAGSAADGSMVWLSPVARSSWPTGALRLEATSFRVFSNQGRTQEIASSPFVNQLRIPLASGSKFYYTATYTFRIIGTAAVTSSDIVPIAQIASGTQIKHTDLGSISGALNAGASQVNAAVVKSVSSTSFVAPDGSTTFTYSIAVSNSSSALQVDQVVDSPSNGLAFVPGSATFDGVPIGDASPLASDASRLIFAGPFAVPAGTVSNPTTKILSYSMVAPTCTGAYNYANSATATIGSVTIGSSSSTQSLTTATGTCGSPQVTSTTTNENLPADVSTAPATSVTISGATLNAMVDPNGTSGLPIEFDYSTSPTLTNPTTVTAGQTTSSTTPYAVSSALTGLTSGTTYYFRARVGAVIGDTFSFTTQEPAGLPTATTVAATSVTTTSAVLNGSVDPNLINNGVKVRFQHAVDNSAGACSSMGSVTTTGFVQSETENSSEDALFLGAYPTDVSFLLSGLTTNSYYCFKVVAYYNATTANWSTAAPSPTWGSFRAVARTAQTIAFPVPTAITVESSTSASATASSGLAVEYTSDTPEVCTVDEEGTIVGLSAGICSITASQPGTVTIDPATPVSVAFLVLKRTQSISFPTPDALVVGDSVSNPATTTASGLVVSYSSSTPEVCSIDSSGFITALAAGSCTIVASQSGDDTYSAATPQSVTVAVRLGQVITFPTPESIPTASTVTALASTTADGLEVHYESVTPTVCSVDETGVITALNVGECRVRASQPGSELYAPAAPVTASFMITPGPPVIITETLPGGTLGSTYDSELEAGGGDGTYSTWTITQGELPAGMVLDESTGRLSGAPTESGTFTIEVTVDSGGVTSAPKSIDVVIAKKPHTLSATSVVATYGDPSLLSPASSSADLPLSYSSSSDEVAMVVDGRIVFGRVGQATISVEALGDRDHVDAATITFSVTVSAAELTVTAPSLTVNYGDPAPALTASITGFVGDENAAVLLTAPTCSTSYDSATDADQTPSVQCSGASAANYTFRYMAGSISIARISQTITLTPDALLPLRPLGSQAVTATSTSGQPVTVVASGECTWQSGVLTATPREGTCVLTASVPKSTNYLAADQVVLTVEVTETAPLSRALEARLNEPGHSHPIDSTLSILWSVEPNVGVPVLSVPTTSGVCTVDQSGAITLISAGLCEIELHLASDDVYATSHAVVNFTVTKLARSISLHSATATAVRPNTIAMLAAPSAGTGPISFQVVEGSEVCAISHTEVVGLRPGACSIIATIGEDGRYLSATSQLLLLSFTDPAPTPSTTPPGAPPVALTGSQPAGEPGDELAAQSAISPPAVHTEWELALQMPRPASGARQFALGSGDAARRTIRELATERLEGFAAGARVATQVTGARSVGQFAVSPGGAIDAVTVSLAMDESARRLGTTFAHIVTVDIIESPSRDTVLDVGVTDDAFEVFAAAGLATPVSVGGIGSDPSTRWIETTVDARGYVPGTVVYLAVTTNPVIVGAALVDTAGAATVTGILPIDRLEVGPHTIRLVGTRVLEGVVADSSGSVVIADRAMDEIERFDLGTMATVEIIGVSATGATHHLVREVLLTGEGPWWTAWLLALVAASLMAWQILARPSGRRGLAAASLAVALLSGLPAVAGWLTGHYDVLVVGLAIGAVGVIGQWLAYRDSSAQGGGAIDA